MQKNSDLTVPSAALEEEGLSRGSTHLLRYLRIRRDSGIEIGGSREWKGYICFRQRGHESLAEAGGTYVGFGSFLLPQGRK